MCNNNSIFCKIIKEKSSNIIYQDNIVTAFNDINPKAPIHILIVTNKLIPTLNDISKKDKYILGHLLFIASKIAVIKNISKDGYRLIINCNFNGGQEIKHLHVHLLGGRYLGPII